MFNVIGNYQMDAILYLWIFGAAFFYYKFFSHEVKHTRDDPKSTEFHNALVSSRIFLVLSFVLFFNFAIAGIKSLMNILGKL